MHTELNQILMSRLGYNVREAGFVAADLVKLDSRLLPLLERWKSEGIESDSREFEGYSIDSLCRDFNMNFIAALLTLDWVIKEPEKAIPVLRSGIR